MQDQDQAKRLEGLSVGELEEQAKLRVGAPAGSPAMEYRQELEKELARRVIADGRPEALEAWRRSLEARLAARVSAGEPAGGVYSVRTFELAELRAELTNGERVAADVLTTALEGGIGYWSQAARIVRRPDGGRGVLDGLEVVAVVLHDPDGDYPPRRLELRDVLRGLEEVASGHARVSAVHAAAAAGLLRAARGQDEEPDFDADDADVIVQVACFGEVVYG